MTSIWQFSPDAFAADYQKLSENQRVRAKRWAGWGLIAMGMSMVACLILIGLVLLKIVEPLIALPVIFALAFAWRLVLSFVNRRIDKICASGDATADHSTV